MIRAKIINQEEKTLGYCSFSKASQLLSKGMVKVKKFYPYTLIMKKTASPEMVDHCRQQNPVVDASQEYSNV
jgi:hypothetical protein